MKRPATAGRGGGVTPHTV